jgi:hypothetical protein
MNYHFLYIFNQYRKQTSQMYAQQILSQNFKTSLRVSNFQLSHSVKKFSIHFCQNAQSTHFLLKRKKKFSLIPLIERF